MELTESREYGARASVAHVRRRALPRVSCGGRPLNTEDFRRLGVHLAVIDARWLPSQPRTAIQSILRYLADTIPTDTVHRQERFFAAFTSRWPIRQPASVSTVSFPRFHTPSSAGLGLTTTSNASDGIVLSFIPERFHSRRSLARYCFISTTFTTTSRLVTAELVHIYACGCSSPLAVLPPARNS